MLKTIFVSFFVILEVLFGIKFVQAQKNYEFIRQVAIIIIMLILAIIIYVFLKLL